MIIDLTNPNIKIEVIAFVRNPVDLVKSSMQEMVKHGEVIENIYSVTVERLKNKFRLTLDKFLQAFSSDEVKVFRMEDAQKHQNGICGYFMQIIGAPELIQNLVSLFYSNQSISYEAIMLLSAVNHSFPLFIDGKSNPERKDLDQFSLIKIPGEKYSISESKRKLIWDNCQEDLKWLYTTFGVNPYSYRYEGKITGTEYWGRKSLEYLDTIFADQPDKIREVLFKCVVKEINVHFEQKDLKEMIFTLKYFFRLSRKAKILLSPQYLFNCYVKWIFYFLISIFKMPFSFLNKPK
ncbi:MAG: hypothetical protein JW798_01890 [Prolixibacteraceae bacterium]|nr:hypothetical protein [Prolixibacteraceae bacterium]